MPTHNRVFTGREDELRDLHAALRSRNAALTDAITALHGMGGVGKTQTAIEYVHRHREDYGFIFWTLGESAATFKAEMASLADELQPPVAALADQEATYTLVRRWFEEHGGWLLVVDNAEGLADLDELIPRHPEGRILLTTRERVPANLASAVEIHHMDEEAGALLLLRRAGRLKPKQKLKAAGPEMQADARQVSKELGGLALALDQAGAYMQDCSLSPRQYLDLYTQRRQDLHSKYENRDHERVDTTFRMAAERLEQQAGNGPAAAQLVRLCAFLAPDAVPDEIFTQGAGELGDPLAKLAADPVEWLDACAAATRYSLLRREADPPALWMHRLAQEVVRDSLTDAEQEAVAEQVVLALSLAFPNPEFPTWPLCERLLPHALLSAQHIAGFGFRTPEAANLLHNTAEYMRQRARYAEAEPLFLEALAIDRASHGEEHREVAAALNNLGVLYCNMGRYEEAIPLFEQALEIDHNTIGEDHPDHAFRLDNLGGVYYSQGRYEEAARLREQALEITKRRLGAEHPDVATSLNNLANVYSSQGRYAEAAELLEEALEIDRKTIGDAHPYYATHLFNLAASYLRWGRLPEAEAGLERALGIYERAHGAGHPDVGSCHFWLGQLREKQGRRGEAAARCRQALAIWERALGPQHPDTVNAREALALVEREALTPKPEAERMKDEG